MPSINEFLRDAWEHAPSAFSEKGRALEFIANDGPPEEKKELALALLNDVAAAAECGRTWATLVRDRLLAAETAMRHLLPQHRDHVLHSAHLYLLGVAIYLKVLRPDSALAAVLADTYYRDAQAFYAPPEVPYTCGFRLIDPQGSLAENRARLGSKFMLDSVALAKIDIRCAQCLPVDLAKDAHAASQELTRFEHCCGPAPTIQTALHAPADAVTCFGMTTEDPTSRLPRAQEDVDAIFRRKWGQAASLHDAAYPLELAARQIDDYLDKTIGPLGCSFSPCPRPFGLQLNRLCDFIAVPLIQNVCTTRFNPLMCSDNSVGLLAANISHKLHVEYAPETLTRMMLSWLETGLKDGQVDHGVFSALLMLRLVNKELVDRLGENRHLGELAYDNSSRRVTAEYTSSAVEFYYLECVDAAAAVYLHNTKKYVNLFKDRHLDYRDHPLAWLLFLCDQLQEWLRPSGEDDGMDLFARARKYQVDCVAGPRLYFDFPDGDVEIREAFRQHLRLFGEEFALRAK
ncbi:MAG TPA: hypothetical protein VM487_10730 [Phycisphaerae bacterium]|nr:hypothetical protein [Phycisphaerae bacterium]